MAKKLGLALGSGGARGLVHLGVLKVLEREGIVPDYIAGASIGSCVGAMYASCLSVEEIEKRIFNSKWEAFKSFMDLTLRGGLVKGEKLGELLRVWIGVDDFADLQLPFVAVAADLLSGDEVDISEGDLIKAVRGSMAIPSLFKPVEWEGNLLVDGGVLNPVPDNVVKKMGAEVILAVNLDYRKGEDQNMEGYKWGVNILKRSFDIARHHLAHHGLKDADIVLNPSFKEPDWIGIRAYFKEEKVKEYIKIGEDLMEEKIDELKGLL